MEENTPPANIKDELDAQIFDEAIISISGVIDDGSVAIEPEVERKTPVFKKKKKERVRDIPYVIPYEKLLSIILNWSNTGNADAARYYFICGYIFAGRVSETLGLRRSDVFIENIAGSDFLTANMITLKRRSAVPLVRRVIVPLDGYEGEIVKMLITDFLPKFFGDEKLFDFDRNKAWRIMNKVNIGPVKVRRLIDGMIYEDYATSFNGFNHYLRHCRLTHLKTKYNMDDRYLQEFVGWQSTRMASIYAHLNTEDMARKFRSSIR